MIKGTTLSIIISSLFTLFVFIPFIYVIFTQAQISIEIILASIIALALMILHLLFLIQSITHQRKAYTMTYGLLLGIIASLVAGLGELYITIPLLPSGSSTFISLTVWSFTYFLIYFFFEELFSDQLQSTRLFMASILLGLSVFSHVMLMFTSGSLSDALWYWADLGYGGMGIFIFGFGIYVLYQSYKYVHRDIVQMSQITGLSFILLGFAVSFIFDFSIFFNLGFGMSPAEFLEPFYGDLLKVIGIVVFTSTYIFEIDYIYRLPYPIHTIVIFNSKSGLCLNITNVQNVESDKGIHVDEQLITGTIKAVMNLLNEGLGSKGMLKAIVSSDQSIVVSSNPQVSIAVITDRPTKVLRYSIELFLKEFWKEYGAEIQASKVIQTQKYKNIRPILKKSFPFLILD